MLNEVQKKNLTIHMQQTLIQQTKTQKNRKKKTSKSIEKFNLDN